MDWTHTETTRFAHVVLPGSTWLESAGSRCSFEGRVLEYAAVSPPPARRAGWECLAGLAGALGIEELPGSVDDLQAELDGLVRAELGERCAWFWNRGEPRPDSPVAETVEVDLRGSHGSIPPPLTHSARYKHDMRERGLEHLRSGSR